MGDSSSTSQYLSFRLDKELFAVDIAKVREVLEFQGVTKVPRTPDYLCGVINLRGNVVPVVDMRLKLGLPVTERSLETCVIITEVEVDGERTVLGALADAVKEVIELDPAEILPPPRMGARIDAGIIRGMGRKDDQFLILLDIDRIFATSVAQELAEAVVSGADEDARASG